VSETETTTEAETETETETVAQKFARDVENHELTILHDDGLYRHLRFKQPDNSFFWFDLVTWPGVLAIRGDMHNQMFSRLRDMFSFFRNQRANYGYWAEKTPDYGRSVREHSPELVRQQIEEHLVEHAKELDHRQAQYALDHARWTRTPRLERWPYRSEPREPVLPKTLKELRELVKTYDENGELEHPDGTRALLRELERLDVVSDVWEWDTSDWTYHYQWACHAIPWGVHQYDVAKSREATATLDTATTADNDTTT
jgi:hypothetical protein